MLPENSELEIINSKCNSGAMSVHCFVYLALDVSLWRWNHVAIKLLAEGFARYIYLQRLKDTSVLLGAIREGVSLPT
jgi:hypothetical protein